MYQLLRELCLMILKVCGTEPNICAVLSKPNTYTKKAQHPFSEHGSAAEGTLSDDPEGVWNRTQHMSGPV